MRGATLPLLLVVVLGLAAPAQPLAGVAPHGAGTGLLEANDGSFVCPDSPFAVEVLYLPGGAVLHTEVLASCPGVVGFTAICCRAALNSSASPPLEVTFFCQGSEAAGLHCEGSVGSTVVTADVGPSAGPGSTVSLSTRGTHRFEGSFLAV